MDRYGERERYYAAHAFNTRGVANAILGNIKEAVDDYDEAIRLNPNFRVALLNRGDLYEKQGKLKDSLVDFEKARHARDPIEDEQDLIIARSPTRVIPLRTSRT
ncbi:tetratricopeptide repeat protein [uncultured Rhodoblastus sp.]|uniref:tetratricopeptide repeat protein n=1 Tax=uncultured Rhodoblastus sp. TaxID=543037 RepID=UPI0025F449D8|nr:tetratricopeptide repeat protein [uncultured Rhodoblastus sp.]